MAHQHSIRLDYRDTTGQVDFLQRWWMLHTTGYIADNDVEGEYPHVIFRYTPKPDTERNFADPIKMGEYPREWSEEERFSHAEKL